MKVEHIYNKNGSYAKTCPNCGAAIESDKCAYCGTTFIDFACIDTEKPFFMKIKRGDNVYIAKVMLISTTINQSASTCFDYRIHGYSSTNLSLDFSVLSFFDS